MPIFSSASPAEARVLRSAWVAEKVGLPRNVPVISLTCISYWAFHCSREALNWSTERLYSSAHCSRLISWER